MIALLCRGIRTINQLMNIQLAPFRRINEIFSFVSLFLIQSTSKPVGLVHLYLLVVIRLSKMPNLKDQLCDLFATQCESRGDHTPFVSWIKFGGLQFCNCGHNCSQFLPVSWADHAQLTFPHTDYTSMRTSGP